MRRTSELAQDVLISQVSTSANVVVLIPPMRARRETTQEKRTFLFMRVVYYKDGRMSGESELFDNIMS